MADTRAKQDNIALVILDRPVSRSFLKNRPTTITTTTIPSTASATANTGPIHSTASVVVAVVVVVVGLMVVVGGVIVVVVMVVVRTLSPVP